MPSVDQDIRNRLLVVRLPTLPHVLLKLIEYCRTDNAGMAVMADLVSKDPGMAAKIIGVANSPAYYRPGAPRIRLEQSLMTLGTDMIRTLVISESVYQTFNNFAASSTVNLYKFWMHSLMNAVIAREIARKSGQTNIDEAYLCGLLHDIGRLAFLVIAPAKYSAFFLNDDDDESCDQEQKLLQITHPEAGAWLMERWKLGQPASDSVLYHHEPLSRLQKAPPLARVIYLSHVLSSYSCTDPAVTQAAQLCEMKLEDLATIQSTAMAKVHETAKFLGIEVGEDDMAFQEKSQAAASAVQQKLKSELQQAVHSSETERNFSRQTNGPALLKTIAQSAKILFGLDDALILMLDSTNQALTVNPSNELQQHLSAFSFRLNRGGAIAEALSQKKPVFVQRGEQLVPEESLMELLMANTLACLPLVSSGQTVGALVGKISPLRIAELEEQSGFLQVFATQAASALLSLQQKQDEIRNMKASAVDEFRLTSRKIVHEANNPLTVIKNYLGVLNDKLSNREPVVSELSILNEEIDRVRDIIQQFAHAQPPTVKKTAHINQLIQDIARMLRDSGVAPSTIDIVTQLNQHATHTDCDNGKVWQILLNLLKNAAEAMPGGGKITIANQGHVNQNGRLYISLLIKDTGKGIPEPILKNLFSPVRTSKNGEHQGLGLSIVQDLIQELNGFIACRSSQAGTTFELMLPAQNPTRAAISNAQQT